MVRFGDGMKLGFIDNEGGGSFGGAPVVSLVMTDF